MAVRPFPTNTGREGVGILEIRTMIEAAGVSPRDRLSACKRCPHTCRQFQIPESELSERNGRWALLASFIRPRSSYSERPRNLVPKSFS